jgi:hypothetical protein
MAWGLVTMKYLGAVRIREHEIETNECGNGCTGKISRKKYGGMVCMRRKGDIKNIRRVAVRHSNTVEVYRNKKKIC